MCTQCIVAPFYFGEVLDGVYLIRARRDDNDDWMKAKDWGLALCNDPFVIWNVTPKPMAEYSNIDDYYMDLVVFETDMFFKAATVYTLYNACIKSGYNPVAGIRLEEWLFNKLARFIEESAPIAEDDKVLLNTGKPVLIFNPKE
jgi:hypothetical protein